MKLLVSIVPNARTSEVVGWESDPRSGLVLKVKIAAPPVEGKANAAIREFLAETLGLPKSAVVLERGSSSRLKMFSIPDDITLPLGRPWVVRQILRSFFTTLVASHGTL